MRTRLGELKEGRDDLRATQRVVNELWRTQPTPGLVFFPAVETIPIFYCVGSNLEHNGVVLAKASLGASGIFAIGVVTQATLVGSTAPVRTRGRLNGAVSGRAANDPVWVGNNGELVFAAPAGPSYAQPIAVCINATDIYVNPEVPVF